MEISMRRLPLVVALLSGPPLSAQSRASVDESAIRRARSESNAAIARHDLPGILAHLEPEFRASTSSGAFIEGREEMGRAFATRFAEFEDATYVRTTESVELSTSGPFAVETGTWVGRWTTPSGPYRTGGRYAAYWRKTNGVWLIHAELYVPLYCEGAGCTGSVTTEIAEACSHTGPCRAARWGVA
jgi:ketosteroid isomerase-like protein